MQNGPKDSTRTELLKDCAIYSITRGALSIPLQPVVRVMVEQQHSNSSLKQAISSLWSKGGWTSFFNAWEPSFNRELLKGLFKAPLMIYAQEIAQKIFPGSSKQDTFARGMTCGLIVGTVDPSVPIDRYRVFKMTNKDPNLNFRGFLNELLQKKQGNSKIKQIWTVFPELFSGLNLFLFRQVTTASSFFLIKEKVDSAYSNQDNPSHPLIEKLNKILLPAGGAVLVSLPLDVGLVQIQAAKEKKSLFSVFNTIYRKGFGAFYSGLVPKGFLTGVSYALSGFFLEQVKDNSSLKLK